MAEKIPITPVGWWSHMLFSVNCKFIWALSNNGNCYSSSIYYLLSAPRGRGNHGSKKQLLDTVLNTNIRSRHLQNLWNPEHDRLTLHCKNSNYKHTKPFGEAGSSPRLYS